MNDDGSLVEVSLTRRSWTEIVEHLDAIREMDEDFIEGDDEDSQHYKAEVRSLKLIIARLKTDLVIADKKLGDRK